MTALQEKLNQVQAGQQAILDLLKKPEAAPAPGAPPSRPWSRRAQRRPPNL